MHNNVSIYREDTMQIMTFKKISIPSVILLVAFGANAAGDGQNKSSFNPVGYWLTEGVEGENGKQIHEAKVEIYTCGINLCGKISSLKEPIDKLTGKPPLDTQNPDEKNRNKPIVGMQFIFNMAADNDETNKWSGGTIYHAAEGKTYTAYITMTDNEHLNLRGYVLGMPLLGQTTVWTRTTKDAKF